MEPFHVFIASSTEGEPVAAEVKSQLETQLGKTAVVDLWTNKFALSEVTIQSLEAATREADFAVVVMTPDDITVSRNVEKRAPRDNLVFELGLFIGAIGRDRTFLVRKQNDEIKLPTDILGMTQLMYGGAAEDLAVSLNSGCFRLAKQIIKMDLRFKVRPQAQAELAANRELCGKIAGAWWERIKSDDDVGLSFFTISFDPPTATIDLRGTGYGSEGAPIAEWRSEMVRLYPVEKRITYLWKGNHPVPKFAHLRFHGYGAITFDSSEHTADPLGRGTGDFWDVDEAHPGRTHFKSIEVRRITDARHTQVMRFGATNDKCNLVAETLENW